MRDLSDGARRLIDSARGAEDPSADDRARVQRQLALKVGIAAAGVAVGAKAAFGGSLAAKIAVAAAVVAAGTGAGLVYVSSRPAPAPIVDRRAVVPSPRIEPLPAPAPQPEVRAETPRPRPRPRPALDTLQAETAMLASAQAAVQARDAAQALSILDDYARRFPSGVLREEGAATRVFALAAAGQDARACDEGRRFLARWPRSPLAARVRGACAAR